MEDGRMVALNSLWLVPLYVQAIGASFMGGKAGLELQRQGEPHSHSCCWAVAPLESPGEDSEEFWALGVGGCFIKPVSLGHNFPCP